MAAAATPATEPDFLLTLQAPSRAAGETFHAPAGPRGGRSRRASTRPVRLKGTS